MMFVEVHIQNGALKNEKDDAECFTNSLEAQTALHDAKISLKRKEKEFCTVLNGRKC